MARMTSLVMGSTTLNDTHYRIDIRINERIMDLEEDGWSLVDIKPISQDDYSNVYALVVFEK